MTTLKIKTSELTGKQLDYAVAVAEGYTPFTVGTAWIFDVGGATTQIFKYSSKWVAGGPIIEREKIAIAWISTEYAEKGMGWEAYSMAEEKQYYDMVGPTPLVAAMRCYVESKLGDEVEVPEELVWPHS